MNAHRAVIDGARRLARAPDWASFTCSKAEAVVWAACVCSADASQQRAAELLAVLAPALARGMQLLSEQQLDVRTLEQHANGLAPLAVLWQVWIKCTQALARFPGKEQALVQLAVQMTRAGFITAFAQLATALTRLISSPEAQQQQQHQMGSAAAAASTALSAIPALVAALLSVFSNIVSIWPGGMQALSNPAMTAAVLAAAELAVATLRNKNAHLLEPATSSSSSGKSTVSGAAGLAFKLYVLPQQFAGNSSSLMLLQMCCVALTAQALHQQQHGMAPVAAGGPEPAAAAGASEQPQQQQQQQGLAVPAYHLQLQQALGLPAGLELDAAELHLSTEQLLSGVLLGLRCVRFQDWHSSSSSASGSDSSSGSTGLQQRQHQPGAAVDAALLAPLLLVLLECCLLQPEPDIVLGCIGVMLQLLDGCEGLDCIPESLAGDLPAAMLWLLVPVIQRLDAAAAASAPAGSGTIAASAGLVLLALSACVVGPAVMRNPGGCLGRTARALTAVFLQQPEQWLALMEAAVRGKMQLEAAVRGQVQRNAATRWLVTHIGALLSAASLASHDDTGVVVSAAAQQQMFSLLISCVKAGATAAVDASTIVLALSACSVFNAFQLPSSTATAAADGLALAVHLLGRALVSAGKGLQRLASNSSSGSSGSALMPQQNAAVAAFTIQMPLEWCADQLPQVLPALPGPVLQQLLDQQAALQQQLAAVQLSEAAAAASVGEQLEAFGAAVVAQVPVKHCCNHPSCTNGSQLTELELVGGKSCVCSGCFAARYCSRECQVAHYKHWHKAVCKRLQEQRQQQQQS